MDSRALFLNLKPKKLFFKAAIPGGISMVVSSLYALFDSIFVGKFLGTTNFAALGLAIPIIIINFALSDLIAVGSAVPISVLLGQKQDEKANNYFTSAIIMILVTGVLMGVFMYFLSPAFMDLLGAEGELKTLAVSYVRVYAVFSPVTTLTFALDNFLRICGRIKTSMFLNVFMSLFTIVLESFFILVLKLGICGAALGAVISMFVCVVIGIWMFIPNKLQLKFRKPHFSGELFLTVIKNGSPAFLTNIASRVFSIVMNMRLLALGGENAVAIYAVLMTVGSVIDQILYGVLDSVQPAIGYNYGAERPERVKALKRCCTVASAVVSVVGAAIIFTLPRILATPFLQDLSLLDNTAWALRLFSIGYLFKWISHSIQSFFMAIEWAFPALTISLSATFLFPLIMIAALLTMGLNGLWLNFPFTSLLSAILAIILIRALRKKIFPQK